MSKPAPSSRAASATSFRSTLTPTLMLAAMTVRVLAASACASRPSSTEKPVVPMTIAAPLAAAVRRCASAAGAIVKSSVTVSGLATEA